MNSSSAMLARLRGWALALCRFLATAGMILLLLFAVSTLFDGVMRWLFSKPVYAVRDIGHLVVAVVVASCIPLAFLERSNITIRLVGKLSERLGRVLDAIAAIIAAVVLFLIVYQFFRHAGYFASGGDHTWMLQIPVAPFWYVVTAILFVAFLVQCLVAILEILRCFGREWHSPDAPDVN